MKTLISFLVINFILSFQIVRSEWFNQSYGINNDLRSVFFIDHFTGWIVGDNCIIHTTNGGSSWNSQEYPFGENDIYTFNSVHFKNSFTGWIAGTLFREPPGVQYSIILLTTNGGANWLQQYSDNNAGLYSICYRNIAAGWSVGQNTIIRSTDHGFNWSEQIFPSGENETFMFSSVCFENAQTGWVAGELNLTPPGDKYKVIYRTTNSGNNWQLQLIINDGLEFNSINFINGVKGWVVGSGIIYHTSNSGTNWTIQQSFGTENCDYYFRSVHFSDQFNGWVGGGSICVPGSGYSRVLLKTNNGGINWSEQKFSSPGTDYLLNSVFFVNAATGWTVGDGGIIMKTTNGGITSFQQNKNLIPDTYILYQNYPNPFNPVTKIKFDIPEESLTQLTIYDIIGREVKVLVNEKLKPGTYEYEWNASDYPSGTYFYKIITNNFSETKRMVLVK